MTFSIARRHLGQVVVQNQKLPSKTKNPAGKNSPATRSGD